MDKTIAYLASVGAVVFLGVLVAGTALIMHGDDPTPLFSFLTASAVAMFGAWNSVKLRKVEKNTNGHLTALAKKAGIVPEDAESEYGDSTEE